MNPFPRYRSVLLVIALVFLSSTLFNGCSKDPLEDVLNSSPQKVTQPGTQPEDGMVFEKVSVCQGCHKFGTISEESPYDTWRGTMMANAARDPLFWALLAVENKAMAAKGVAIGDFCLRCHAPKAWLEGRSEDFDGSGLTGEDFNSVLCDFCHRFVDPKSTEGKSLTEPDVQFYGNAQFVTSQTFTPIDVKRGPYSDAVSPYHPSQKSDYFTKAEFCANCHEINNPVYNNTVAIEKTYSEWKYSSYNPGTPCQSCHMPLVTGQAASAGPQRNNIAQHRFVGGNAWAPLAIQEFDTTLSSDDKAHLNQTVQLAKQMLKTAAALSATVSNGTLEVKVTNLTGHKLPTGYAEGRRMWINVKFYDQGNNLVSESAAYDTNTGVLDEEGDAKVYEAHYGLKGVEGYPDGQSFHFALNNTVVKDNRIPPSGFTNAAFDAAGAPVVGATYADGQNYDTTSYSIPNGATSAVVTLKYQTTSKEFIEFLRDENVGNSYDIKGAGQKLYDIWVQTGRSAPVDMKTVTVTLP